MKVNICFVSLGEFLSRPTCSNFLPHSGGVQITFLVIAEYTKRNLRTVTFSDYAQNLAEGIKKGSQKLTFLKQNRLIIK